MGCLQRLLITRITAQKVCVICETIRKGLVGAASSAIKAPARWIGLLKKNGKSVEADEPYDPLDFVRIEGEARDRGLTLLGLFHSHPGGAAEPSDADRRGAWPGQCCWIGALRADGSIELGAFPLNGGSLAAGQADRQKRMV